MVQKKPASANREASLRVLVTPAEQKMIETAAAKENRSVSSWLRLAVLAHLKAHRGDGLQ